ncbi:LacI family transcriptional regulator [Marinobacterium aestuarii]|uniref:LacI family transcriptional regulator n=1 Tax=Marinobacterium aestuarii TaxID=1821621 RepID=A0A1A9EUR9_9GAMM|nr:LacI family DNA-binding transcriptional regulator [Marinobacterium aestuarii]ANG61587.1 LacI family transcriptional regulator [Marinobacterium aestuarii]
MKTPTLADVAKKAGVGIATVDRVVNGRVKVRPETAQQVLEAAEAIGYRGAGIIRRRLEEEAPERRLGFILQKRSTPFYKALAEELIRATEASKAIRGTPVVEFIDELKPQNVVDAMHKLAAKVDALAVVTANHPAVCLAIDQLHAKGIPTFALVSDLTTELRAGHVGRENRKAGRTAAWSIARLSKKPGKVVVLLGSHSYLCQEICEISFRSYFRENAPQFQVLETLVSREDPEQARASIQALIENNADLVGIYVAGGGIEGIIEVLRKTDPATRPFVVCTDLTEETRIALIDGTVDLVLSNPRDVIAERLVEAMARVLDRGMGTEPIQIPVPLEIYTSENL